MTVLVTFVHHRVVARPRRWQSLADRLTRDGRRRVTEAGGALYGIFRSQIGRPRDELQILTVWSRTKRAGGAERTLLGDDPDVLLASSELLLPTLRPTDTTPLSRQGNYASRWFATPAANWPEFLDLCAQAWPGFEEQAVRDKLSRRYDICDWTVVSTATLLSATDRPDTARWT